MSQSLESYIEKEILTRYDSFDLAHRRDHVISVIKRSIKLAEILGENVQMSYAAAAFHDLGLAEDRKKHHIISGRIVRVDKFLPLWFTAEQIEIIAQAAEDHRASAKTPPRSVYGKILAEADRDLNPETVIARCVQYELSHNSDLPIEEQIRNVVNHLHKKYGKNGYITLYIPGSENEKNLQSIRSMLDSAEQSFAAVKLAFDTKKSA